MPLWYTTSALIVGFLQVFDGLSLWKQRGQASSLSMQFSFFEYVWAAISAWVVYKLWPEPQSQIWLPAIFIVYVIIMGGWGIYEFRNHNPDLGIPVLKPSMVYAGIAFGSLFLLCSIYVLLFSGIGS